MDNDSLKRIHIIVEGRVQGVGFRYFVLENANLLDVTGWVRNLRDGSVEITAEGSVNSLNELLAIVRRGSPSSFVSDTKTDWSTFTDEFTNFRIKPSF